MQNQTLIQYFHWYYQEQDLLWLKVAKEAENLARLGFTAVWLPPAYKGAEGNNSVGYDAYDLFDLGEFDQKNSIPTKYGDKSQYLQAIQTLQKNDIQVLADAVFNHKAGGDELEKLTVRKVNEENRHEFISEEFEIEAWTRFTFPGRKGQYSNFIWDHQCFTGVDWAENIKETAIFAIQNEYGAGWEFVPSDEMGNYDYLMCNDIEFRNQAVREELHHWGKWFYDTTKVDGFRLDAVKHISPDFIHEWIMKLKESTGRDFFIIAENWEIENAEALEQYINHTEGATHLFDSLLHYNFFRASKEGSNYPLNQIFEHTLIRLKPERTITIVDNHDSQPHQALESYVEQWFRPLAYAMILLRKEGIPCVFYPDLYGANYEDNENQVELPIMNELSVLLQLRKEKAYGEQRDYLDHPNCIGWVRSGNQENANSGLAVVMSNGDEGFKEMEVGREFTGQTFIDALGNRQEEVIINDQGTGVFHCNGGSVAVWIARYDDH